MTSTLSDTQRAILTAASSAEDRLVQPAHVPLKGGAVRIVLQSLLKRRLLGEVQAAEGDPVWWNSPAGVPLALRVTGAGREAIGLIDAADPGASPAAKSEASPVAASSPPKAIRSGTKQAALIALLQREEGATINEMVGATGWLSHTVRGAMAGALKKRLGMEIGSEKIEGRGRVYWVA